MEEGFQGHTACYFYSIVFSGNDTTRGLCKYTYVHMSYSPVTHVLAYENVCFAARDYEVFAGSQ